MGLKVAILVFLQVLYSNCVTNISPFQYNKYECLTPNHNQGLCLSLFTCPPLLRIHLNAPMNNRSESFLEESYCEHGFGAEPFVCCSSEVDFTDNIPKKMPDHTHPTKPPNARTTNFHKTTRKTSTLKTTTRSRTTLQSTPKTTTRDRTTLHNTTHKTTTRSSIPQTTPKTTTRGSIPQTTPKTTTRGRATPHTTSKTTTRSKHTPQTTPKTTTHGRTTKHGIPKSNIPKASTRDRTTRYSTKIPRTSKGKTKRSTLKTTTRSRSTQMSTKPPPSSSNLLATPEDCIVRSNNDIAQYNSLVLIQGENLSYKGSIKGNGCSGSLISHLYVLTSALCALNYKAKTVRIGNYQPSQNSNFTDYKIQNKVIYPTWNDTSKCYMDDIALIRLDRSVPYDNYTGPICLPSTVGFTGSRDEGNVSVAAHMPNDSGQNLRYFVKSSKVVKDSMCLLKLGKGQMCSSGNFTRYVPTNFGGPLARIYHNKWVISGVASRGYNVHTNTFVVVPEYEKWILKNIKQ